MNIEKAKEILQYDPVAGIAINTRTGKTNQRTLVLDGKKEYLNRVLYEMYNGPIGKGVVVFKDGNKENFCLTNLVLDSNKTAVVTRTASAYRTVDGIEEKSCTQCGSWKSLDQFEMRSDTEMPRGECAACTKAKKQVYYSHTHRQRERRCSAFRLTYGISHDDYDNLLFKQNSGCAICGTKDPSGVSGRFKFFSIDHCHTTGKVRGLLCNHCNRGLGFLRDSADLLTKAVDYLKQSEA